MKSRLYFDQPVRDAAQEFIPATYVSCEPRGNAKPDNPAFRLTSMRDNGEVIDWATQEVIGRWAIVARCTRTRPLLRAVEYYFADAVEVQLADGRIVPCIRPTGSHQILQNFEYKIRAK